MSKLNNTSAWHGRYRIDYINHFWLRDLGEKIVTERVVTGIPIMKHSKTVPEMKIKVKANKISTIRQASSPVPSYGTVHTFKMFIIMKL